MNVSEVTMKKILISIVLIWLLSSFSGFGQDRLPPERGSFSFKLGVFSLGEDENFWRETEEIFIFEVEDLNDLVLGMDFTTSINRVVEFGIGRDYFHSSVTSEYRDYIGDDGLPILHDTTLEILPIQVSMKFLPGGRYSDKGKYFYTLNKVVPYIGGGLGLYLWEYRESGEFIDSDDMSIFLDSYASDGAAVGLHAMAGVEIPFDPTWSILLEAKYTAVEDELDNDFSGYGDIDLGGWSFSLGASFRF
jgi:hypothetical protein